jgi:hypothetical protein
VQNNRLMQPPQNSTLAQGLRPGAPQQLQLPQQPGQGLRVTPPRPANLSPTGQHFTTGTPALSLQPVLQLVQQQNPQLSLQDATKVALDHLTRLQQQQHLQQLAKSSPTQQNQQIRRSPSQNANPPHPQGHQRMS